MKLNSWLTKACIGTYFVAHCALAAEPHVTTIRYVAVGVSEYAEPGEPGWSGMPSVSGANISARTVAQQLATFGGQGETLGSRAGRYVSVKDINEAIERVIAEPHDAQTLFVFYFAGHGISEGIAWNQFLIPGDFAYQPEEGLDIETLDTRALHTATLVDTLNKHAVPFLLLIDACYEGQLEDFRNTALSETATQSLIDVAAVLKVINEFRDDYPVLFSTEPGTLTKTVAHPFKPNSPFSIGPLARRLLLALAPSKQNTSIQSLVNTLRSPTLDPQTRPAVSRVRSVPHLGVLTSVDVIPNLQELEGSAVRANLDANTSWEATSEFVSSVGSFRLVGDAGNFVSGGQDNRLESPDHAFEIEQFAPNHVQLWIDDGEWIIELSQPGESRFVPGKDYRASNEGKEDDVVLDISGDGRGCNNTTGTLSIESVNYELDSLEAIDVVFRYRCEDDTSFAEGHLRLQSADN